MSDPITMSPYIIEKNFLSLQTESETVENCHVKIFDLIGLILHIY